MSRVLIVDDNEDLRAVLRIYLLGEGLEVLEAGDGETALEHLARGGIDLALLDVVLPGCSGVDVLKAIHRGPWIPVLLTSSLARSEIEGVGDADGFIRKPFSPKDVVAQVTALLKALPSG